MDWRSVTGQKPPTRRSDIHFFPGLIYDVFQLCEVDGAEQALRRYWTAVAKNRGSDPSDDSALGSSAALSPGTRACISRECARFPHCFSA